MIKMCSIFKFHPANTIDIPVSSFFLSSNTKSSFIVSIFLSRADCTFDPTSLLRFQKGITVVRNISHRPLWDFFSEHLRLFEQITLNKETCYRHYFF